MVVCGGLGGVMEAVCKGAHRASGRTIGILPGKDYRDANPYVDISIVTGIGEARNSIVARSARGHCHRRGIRHAERNRVRAQIRNSGDWLEDVATRARKKPARIIQARDAKEAVELAIRRSVN